MTLRIFHSLNLINKMEALPIIQQEDKVDFKFTKPNMKKLIIFDLDETLIHTIRDEEDLTMQELQKMYGSMVDIRPDHTVSMTEPESGQTFNQSFFERPFVRECLEGCNKDYEVAVFTAGFEWYANPIIDKIDPQGTLI